MRQKILLEEEKEGKHPSIQKKKLGKKKVDLFNENPHFYLFHKKFFFLSPSSLSFLVFSSYSRCVFSSVRIKIVLEYMRLGCHSFYAEPSRWIYKNSSTY